MRPASPASPFSLESRLRRFSDIAFAIVAGIAAAAIWGWTLGAPALRDYGAIPPLDPAGALAYLLLAASFFASRAQDPRARRSAILAAALSGFIALAALLA